MASETVTLVQMARLGDLAQTWLLISRLLRTGRIVRLVVENGLTPLAQVMVGKENVVGIDTGMLRRLADQNSFIATLRTELARLSSGNSDYVINLNFHPAIALLAEAIPALKHGGARWRDVTLGKPSDAVFGELFRHAAGEARLSGRHLSEVWGAYCEAPTAYGATTIQGSVLNDVNKLFERHAIDSQARPLAIIVGAGLGVRACPPNYWRRFIELLESKYQVILIGSSEEYSRGEEIKSGSKVVNLCGQTDPGSLAGLLSKCELVIGTDTGPLHVGAMTGTKCLGLYFGSMYHRQTGPYGKGHVVVIPNGNAYPCDESTMARCTHEYPAPPVELVAETVSFMLSGGEIKSRQSWKVLRSSITGNSLKWHSVDTRKTKVNG